MHDFVELGDSSSGCRTKDLRAFEVRFGPAEYEGPTTALAKLRQSTSVPDYQAQFETLTNRTEGLNEAFMIFYIFIQ